MQLKKHFSLILAFLLLVSHSGLAINVHFCDGKIASISSVFAKEDVCRIPLKEKTACCAKPKPQHKKCCSDKEVNLKAKSEKMVVTTISFELQAVYFINVWNLDTTHPLTVGSSLLQDEYYCDANAPPLYQLYCQYTLFG